MPVSEAPHIAAPPPPIVRPGNAPGIREMPISLPTVNQPTNSAEVITERYTPAESLSEVQQNPTILGTLRMKNPDIFIPGTRQKAAINLPQQVEIAGFGQGYT